MNKSRCPGVSLVLAGLLLTGVLLATGCATTKPPVHSMRDPQANFSAYKTFAWDTDRSPQVSAQPMSILDSNIRAAITSELQTKGYAEAAAGTLPDLVLQYETAAAEMIKSSPFRIGIGVGGYGSNGGASVGASSAATKNVREGTLVLRVVDPTRNAEVWNGRVSREIGTGGAPDSALVHSAVRELLQGFPARGGDLH